MGQVFVLKIKLEFYQKLKKNMEELPLNHLLITKSSLI
jgi:hypothetical protein